MFANGKKPQWRNAQAVSDAKVLVDQGVLLTASDAKNLLKMLPAAEQKELCQHFAMRFAERASDRLSGEIAIESALVFLSTAASEELMVSYLEELLQAPDADLACRTLVEMTLTSELSSEEGDPTLFATAVALICELGLGVQMFEREHPGHMERARSLLDHIATYLLSVSNCSSQAVRLSLMRYFSYSELGKEHKLYFTRIIGRFGHSVLDQLFNQLFNKKSEAVALQYLLENLPCAFETAGECQVILHETFKHYMMKNPERFSLFLHALGDHFAQMGGRQMSYGPAASFFRHCISLLKVSSDLNHKQLAKEVLAELYKFEEDPQCGAMLMVLQSSTELRRSFREMVAAFRADASSKRGKTAVISQFRADRRGRKPSLGKDQTYGFLHQVTFLGQPELPKAS